MTLDESARAELEALEAAHRRRMPRVVDGRQGPTIVLDGVEVINLASNDYLSLAGDPRLAAAARGALEEAGVGAGASRLIVGNQRAHVQLERAVADWMRCDGVRLFNTGYAANMGVLTALLQAGDVVFSDELNHASIIDGCRLSKAEVVIVPHRDLAALETGLRQRHGRRRIVVSESLFSMDGDVADVEALATIAHRHDAALVLDEAHAIGVMGPEGRGVHAEHCVKHDRPDVVVGTFGKALGTFGAFVATTASVAELLWNRARSFVFSTALPPVIPAATLAAIELVRGREGDDRRARLAGYATGVRAAVLAIGGAPKSPIAPVIVGDDRRVMQISAALLEAGIFVPGIRPPTVPTARLRLCLTAGHSEHQLRITTETLNNALRLFT